MTYYSPLKIFHHRGRIDALREGNRPNLLHVQLIPTNRCNQNCNFCAYRTHGYSSSREFDPRDEIPFAKLQEIVQDARRLGVGAIEITGGGEPLMHKQFPGLCRCIREEGLDYGVVTNGSLMNDGILEALLGAKWVRFSLDAAGEDTYAKTRRISPKVFHQVRSHLRSLVGSRLSEEPIVGVGFVVTANNWQEIFAAAGNAREDGVDNFRISAVFQDKGVAYFHAFHDRACEVCRQAETLQDKRFVVFNLFHDRIEDLEQRSPFSRFCGLQHLCTYIGADQNLYRCCVVSYNEQGLLASVREQSFYEAWLSERVAERLWQFDARSCPRCMFNAKNKAIAYAMDQNPTHVNFI